jgi:parallel beta-helix repeat protein
MKLLGSIGVVLLFITSLFAGVLFFPQESEAQHIPHDPISIEGDEDFARQAANESWPGDGSEENPFLISGLEINASRDIGIGIWNTSVNFIINDSKIIGFRGDSKGIYMHNVTNGRIDNCTITATRNAIEIVESNEIQIVRSNITDNYWRGILLTNSDNNMIAHNNISETEWRSIYLDHSNNNYIINNSITNNTSIGLVLYFSRGNTIRNNTFFQSGISIEGRELEDWASQQIDDTNMVDGRYIYFIKNQVGGTVPTNAGQIILVNCSDIVIDEQKINGTNIAIHLVYSSKNIITNNYALYNVYSLYLYHSNNNTIVNNIASNGYYGIFLDSSSYNHIENNTISHNYWGLQISSNSNHNKVLSNLLNGNWMPGILISQSNRTTLSDNMMMYCGIEIEGELKEHWNSHDIDISNTVNGKPIYYLKNQKKVEIPKDAGQIFLANCSEIIVENHFLSELSEGITLAFSSNIEIINNTVTKCNRGISLSYSEQNYIINNKVYSNSDGISIHRSHNNTVVNNTIKANSIGIYLYRSNNNNFGNNTALNNNNHGIGIYYSNKNNVYNNNLSLNHEGAVVYHSDENRFFNNAVDFNDQQGFRISYSNETELLNNKISNNKWYGISLDDSFRMIILANHISNNRYSFSFRHSEDSIIHHNNLINNSFYIDTYRNTNKWHNGAGEGNYWSDYEGLDNGSDYRGSRFPRIAGDGIGDTDLPHNRVDKYPLMEPVDITRQYEVWYDEEVEGGEEGDSNFDSYFLIVIVITIISSIFLILVFRKNTDSDGFPSKQELHGLQTDLGRNENQSMLQYIEDNKIKEEGPNIGEED